MTDYYEVLEDRRLFHGVLSLLYVARRQDVRNPGVGTAYLAKTLGCPHSQLEFPVWYLKQRKWIEVLENGQLAITADGVDKLADTDAGILATPGAETRSRPSPPRQSPSKAGSPAGKRPPSPVPARARTDGTSRASDDDLPDIETFLDEAFADDTSSRT